MRRFILVLSLTVFVFSSISCANKSEPESVAVAAEDSKSGGVVYLNKQTFLTEVFDFTKSKEWKYNGEVPAIVDFYADWCGPCKMLSPVLEQLQKEYGGKIQIFKIDTDKEKELAATFGIRSLPTVVFIPMEGKPSAVMGFKPKAELENMIGEVLKVQKP